MQQQCVSKAETFNVGNLKYHRPDQETMLVQLKWQYLPRHFVLQFPQPFFVLYHGEVVAEAEAESEFKTQSEVLYARLRAQDTSAYVVSYPTSYSSRL